MAEGEAEGQERTEEPTSKRLAEAKEKGDVPRSKELNTTVVLMAGALALLIMGRPIGDGLANMLRNAFTLDRAKIFDPRMMQKLTGDMLVDAFVLIVPVLAILLVSVFVSPIIMGGFTFSAQPLQPKFSRINPVTGLKRLFSMQGLMELVKSLLKILLIGGTGAWLIWMMFRDVLQLSSVEFEAAYTQSASMIGWYFLAVCSTIALIAAFDVPFQRWQYRKKLRMTKQEVKEERKNTEGSPEVKGKIRRMQMETAMRRMMEEVPKADVVITNPTHYAVALRYDDKKMRAPRVVAKGSGLIAARIREIAQENRVPMFSAPPLARAIYFNTEIDQEIPASLYLAVAQVLAYVYQLKRATRYGQEPPQAPTDLDVPDDLWKGRH